MQKGLHLHLVQAPFTDEETLQSVEVTISQGSSFSPSILTDLSLSPRPRVVSGLGPHAHSSHLGDALEQLTLFPEAGQTGPHQESSLTPELLHC